MRCQVCNAEAPEGAAFCQDCGAKLPAFDPATSQVDTAELTSGGTPRPKNAPSASRKDVPEETLWEGSYSPKDMLGVFAGCAVATIVLLVLAVGFTNGVLRLVLLAAILVLWLAAAGRLMTKRLGVYYKLTNQMFYHRKGVLTRVTDRVELIEVHDVTWQQGPFERLMGVGTIIISSADRTHPQLPLRGIENVEEVAGRIDRARRGEQVRRGRRIDFSAIDGQT